MAVKFEFNDDFDLVIPGELSRALVDNAGFLDDANNAKAIEEFVARADARWKIRQSTRGVNDKESMVSMLAEFSFPKTVNNSDTALFTVATISRQISSDILESGSFKVYGADNKNDTKIDGEKWSAA